MLPSVRTEDLLTVEVADELLVYDLVRHEAHSLNRIATRVWHLCDGTTSVAAMAATLESELGSASSEELVWLALERLDKGRLLQEPLVRPAGIPRVSRRDLVKKLGQAGVASALLPMVTSIIAPTPAEASSAVAREHPAFASDGLVTDPAVDAFASGVPVTGPAGGALAGAAAVAAGTERKDGVRLVGWGTASGPDAVNNARQQLETQLAQKCAEYCASKKCSAGCRGRAPGKVSKVRETRTIEDFPSQITKWGAARCTCACACKKSKASTARR